MNPPSGGETEPSPHRSLSVLAGLVALQGAGLVAVGCYYLVRLALDRPADLLGVLGVAVLALLGAAGLLAAARGLAASRAWARAPVLVVEVIIVAVSRDIIPSLPWLGVPLLVWALSVAVLLFVRPVSRALQR